MSVSKLLLSPDDYEKYSGRSFQDDFDEIQRKKDERQRSGILAIFKNKKIKIPDDLRWKVWERDNFTCKNCGSRSNLAVDHIQPESKGGTLELANLQTLCKSCNSKKGKK